MGEEIELKLEVPEGAGGQLLGRPWAKHGWRSHPQCSVYFDTTDNEVRKSGYTLRVRTVGDRFIQTAKSLDGGAGLFQRGEWEHQIDGPVPDAERLRHTPLAALDVSQLRPVMQSDVTRHSCLSQLDGAEIEIVLDEGEMCAGGRNASVSEIEIELIRGEPAAAVTIARDIAAAIPVKLGVLSKAERGFALAEGKLGKVVKAEPVPVRPGMSVAEGFAAIVGACLRHFRLNEPIVIEKRLPTALHQSRVAMRRLRSALSLFRTAVTDAEFPRLRDELRWFTGQLGDARNLDVYLQSELGPDERMPIEKRRKQAYDRVIAAMDSVRVRSLMLDLVAWSMLGEWRDHANAQRPIEPYASGRIDRLWHGISRAHHLATMDDDERHRLRIRIKKIRYALEFMANPFARQQEQQRRFARAVEDLQEWLGHLNDVVVARTLVMADAWPIEPNEPSEQERDFLREADDALDRLREVGPYWRDA